MTDKANMTNVELLEHVIEKLKVKMDSVNNEKEILQAEIAELKERLRIDEIICKQCKHGGVSGRPKEMTSLDMSAERDQIRKAKEGEG